jgi:tetratricopeptide (TPR) repeat protein
MKIRQQRPGLAKALDKLVTSVFSIGGKFVSRPQSSSVDMGAAVANRADPYESAISSARDAYDNGRLGEALHLFGKVVELSPHEPWGWHGRGDCMQLSGDYMGALQAYEKAVDFGGGAYSHFGLGNAHHGLGDTGKAKAAWRQALDLDPELEIAKRALAIES